MVVMAAAVICTMVGAGHRCETGVVGPSTSMLTYWGGNRCCLHVGGGRGSHDDHDGGSSVLIRWSTY